MLKLFCRYCWKETETWYGENSEHIEARCKICGGWIKFLTKQEIKNLVKLFISRMKNERPIIGRSYSRRPRNAPIVVMKKPPGPKEDFVKRSKTSCL